MNNAYLKKYMFFRSFAAWKLDDRRTWEPKNLKIGDSESLQIRLSRKPLI